jgi:hypothetical protein
MSGPGKSVPSNVFIGAGAIAFGVGAVGLPLGVNMNDDVNKIWEAIRGKLGVYYSYEIDGDAVTISWHDVVSEENYELAMLKFYPTYVNVVIGKKKTGFEYGNPKEFDVNNIALCIQEGFNIRLLKRISPQKVNFEQNVGVWFVRALYVAAVIGVCIFACWIRGYGPWERPAPDVEGMQVELAKLRIEVKEKADIIKSVKTAVDSVKKAVEKEGESN